MLDVALGIIIKTLDLNIVLFKRVPRAQPALCACTCMLARLINVQLNGRQYSLNNLKSALTKLIWVQVSSVKVM